MASPLSSTHITNQSPKALSGLQPGGDINQFIFNEVNFNQYSIGALQALSQLNKTILSVTKPFSGIQAPELAQHIKTIDCDEPLPTLTDALAEVEQLYLNHAVYFHHPQYMAHLNCPVAYPAVIAEQILSAVNTSVDTWDQSGGATLIEQKLIDWTCEKIGFEGNADGIFTSGGTQSNLMAMLVARDHAIDTHAPYTDAKQQGLPDIARKFRIFTSRISHFSIQKAAALLGLGYDAVVSVAVDGDFRMDMAALNEEINTAKAQGLIPIAVVATAGTTDFGSIDPIADIAAVCRAQDMWVHVDAAYGGGLLISQHDTATLNGMESADSVTVDYHKSFMQPVSCSGFFLKNRQHFRFVTHHADYLNPLSDTSDGIPNLVDKSLQTTRRFDALKLWMTLRTVGTKALGQGFDSVRALARQSYMVMHEDQDIETLHVPQLTALVFRFNPASYSLTSAQLDEVNNQIRSRLLQNGALMIARTKVNGGFYLKFTLLNPATSIEDIKTALTHIKALGSEVADKLLCQTEANETDGGEA